MRSDIPTILSDRCIIMSLPVSFPFDRACPISSSRGGWAEIAEYEFAPRDVFWRYRNSSPWWRFLYPLLGSVSCFRCFVRMLFPNHSGLFAESGTMPSLLMLQIAAVIWLVPSVRKLSDDEAIRLDFVCKSQCKSMKNWRFGRTEWRSGYKKFLVLSESGPPFSSCHCNDTRLTSVKHHLLNKASLLFNKAIICWTD